MPDSHQQLVSAAILAGGRSRRMGADKAAMRLVPGGRTLLEIAIDAADTVSSDVMVVGRDAMTRDSHVRWLPDEYPDSGPLGGIASALQAATHDRCLVLSCDSPFLSIGVLKHLINTDFSGDAVIPATHATSRQGAGLALQTMCAVYNRSCLPLIERSISNGELRTTSWLDDAHVLIVAEDELRPIDPDLLTFFSVNTPADLQWAEAIASMRSAPE